MMNYSRNMKLNIKNTLALIILLLGIIAVLAVTVCACIATDATSQSTEAEQESMIKPSSEPTINPVIETSETSTPTDSVQKDPELVSLGEYKLTAYCGCPKCCGKWGENRPLDETGKPIVYTANQSIAKEGVTIAADINVLPYGTAIIIDGHRYIVQDRGGSIAGNKIDIYFESHQAALEFGVQYKEVFIEREVKNND